MEDKTLIWFEDLEASRGITSWYAVIKGLQKWFGPSAYEDHMEALTMLKQTTTVEAYKTKFKVISN